MAGITSVVLQQMLWLLFTTKGLSVPASMNCPPTEMIRLSPTNRLELDCKSLCGPQGGKFEWLKSNGEKEDAVLDYDGSKLVVESVDYGDGGTYKCRCLPSSPQCQLSVYITPSMEFWASDKSIYSGESVDFACTVFMTQPKFPTIRKISGESMSLSSYDVEETFIDQHTAEIELWLYKQEELKGEYVCEVESYINGELVETLQMNLSIYSYVPPEILFTTEFKLKSREDFGKVGKLGCSVSLSPDTGSEVTWLFKGEAVPLDQGKYSLETISKNQGVTEYALLVSDVQEKDLGPYVCRLESGFNLENEQEVWIKFVDGQSVDVNTANDGATVIYIISLMGVAVCVLGVWLKCKRKTKGGLLGHDVSPSTSRSFINGSGRKRD